MFTLLGLLAVTSVVASVRSGASTVQVRTRGGEASGLCGTASCVFRAIPFAQPPTGDGRFAPPRPAVPWEGVHDGTKPGPACWQTPLDPTTPQSEDCLHVDVWTPPQTRAGLGDRSSPRFSAASTRAPVIVFFYGGGALSGANYWYNFSRFANDGVIVVAANYRLGPLGFMALSQLSAVSATGASGNYGAMDCYAAVQWAAANAEAFGGDPDSVTIMGQSSGATMVWALMAHAQPPTPLFKHAIALSGSPNISMTRENAERQNAAFPAAVGCGANGKGKDGARAVVACLRHNATAEAISYGHVPINTTWQEYDVHTWGLPSPSFPHGWPLPGVVIVDGDFMPQTVGDAMASGTNSHVNLFVSNVAEEADLSPNHDFTANKTQDELEAFAARQFAPWGKTLGRSLLESYYPAAAEHPQQAYVQMASEMGTTCGQLHLVQLARDARSAAGSTSRPGQPRVGTLHYAVTAAGPSSPQVLGVADAPGYVSAYAYHQFDLLWGMESWNWFANFTGVVQRLTPTDADRHLAATLRAAWFGFIKGESTVPPFAGGATSASSYTVGVIDGDGVAGVAGWRQELCNALQAAKVWQPFWWTN